MPLTISEPIDTQEKLRMVIPHWDGNASKKDYDRINDVAEAFIARSP